MTYDNWKLDDPFDGPDDETVADFYGIDVDVVTWAERSRYEEDKAEQYANPW